VTVLSTDLCSLLAPYVLFSAFRCPPRSILRRRCPHRYVTCFFYNVPKPSSFFPTVQRLHHFWTHSNSQRHLISSNSQTLTQSSFSPNLFLCISQTPTPSCYPLLLSHAHHVYIHLNPRTSRRLYNIQSRGGGGVVTMHNVGGWAAIQCTMYMYKDCEAE
jgi:hypothetical protein